MTCICRVFLRRPSTTPDRQGVGLTVPAACATCPTKGCWAVREGLPEQKDAARGGGLFFFCSFILYIYIYLLYNYIYIVFWLVSNSDGLQPNSEGLRPNSDGLQ